MVGVWPLLPNIVQMLSVLVSLVYAIGIVWLGILLIQSSQEIQKSIIAEWVPCIWSYKQLKIYIREEQKYYRKSLRTRDEDLAR